jgi:hypothetical protein
MNMGDVEVGELCEMGFCTIPAGTPVTVPCLDEIIGLFDCALSLPNLCAADGSAQDEANQQVCQDPLESFGTCFENEYEPPSTDNPGEEDPDPPGEQPSCTPAGGCENCASECLSCYCEIADDPTPDQMMCIEACTPPMP